MARRALFILNPAARKAPALEKLRAAIDSLDGWEARLESTAGPGHATALAREAAAGGLDAAVACGGDGTVNEVANGLAGSATALAVVRGGTANVWAKEVRLPRNPQRAARVLVDGETRAVKLGKAGERHFLLMAGVGFDAEIVRELEAGAKRRWGAAAYLLHGIRRTMSYRGTESDLSIEGEALRSALYWLLLGNTRSYAGVLNLTHLARADDGQLELLLLRRGGLLRIASLVPSVLLRRHHRRRAVLYREVRSIDVRTPGLAVQVDGEYLGETPMRFEVVEGALRVIVPKGLRSPLFSPAAG